LARYRATVDRNICNGFGACVELCPEFFYLSDIDGKSKIKDAEEIVEGDSNIMDIIEVEEESCLRKAENACPFNAIRVEEF
jgi:ferredoxin